jgi:hypothetical protein
MILGLSSGATARAGGASGGGSPGPIGRRFRSHVRRLIITMARANPTWDEERIGDELLMKLGLAVSPRTWDAISGICGHCRRSQRWATLVRNHAHPVLACDFLITVTARFHVIGVFVIAELLDSQVRRRMLGHIPMDNPSACRLRATTQTRPRLANRRRSSTVSRVAQRTRFSSIGRTRLERAAQVVKTRALKASSPSDNVPHMGLYAGAVFA